MLHSKKSSIAQQPKYQIFGGRKSGQSAFKKALQDHVNKCVSQQTKQIVQMSQQLQQQLNTKTEQLNKSNQIKSIYENTCIVLILISVTLSLMLWGGL